MRTEETGLAVVDYRAPGRIRWGLIITRAQRYPRAVLDRQYRSPACLRKEVLMPRQRRKRKRIDVISPAMLARAEREAAANKALIESGETFAARKPSTWRRGRGSS